MSLAELIKDARKRSGLTLEAAGNAAGISKGHLHDLESGHHLNPTIYTCVRLSVVLGLTVQAMGAAQADGVGKARLRRNKKESKPK